MNARILITGASSGIGRALALQAAQAGAHVILNARRTERLEELRLEIQSLSPSSRVLLVPGDVTLPEVRTALITQTVENFGGLDILVNNAGAAATGLFEGNSPARLQSVMELNFTAPVELIRLAIPILKEWKTIPAAPEKPIPPMIVNLSSIVGLRGVTHYSEYCAAKAAIRAFSESLRTELSVYGIEVLVVCPGSTETGFFTEYLENTGEPTWPSHNRVSPEYVASEILKAIRKGKMQIIPFFLGKVMYHLNHFAPRFLERAMVRYQK